MRSIDKEFAAKIEEKVAELEKLSSLEFVPVFVARSSQYRSVRIAWAATASLLAVTVLHNFGIWLDWYWELIASFLFLIGTYLALDLPPLLRLLTPRSLRERKVADEAYRSFLRNEVFATRHRTGILILISKLERSVFILADRGLRAKVEDAEWKRLGQILACDFDARNPGPTFLNALETLTVRLKDDFPILPDDTNELSNRLRVE